MGVIETHLACPPRGKSQSERQLLGRGGEVGSLTETTVLDKIWNKMSGKSQARPNFDVGQYQLPSGSDSRLAYTRRHPKYYPTCTRIPQYLLSGPT